MSWLVDSWYGQRLRAKLAGFQRDVGHDRRHEGEHAGDHARAGVGDAQGDPENEADAHEKKAQRDVHVFVERRPVAAALDVVARSSSTNRRNP